ncbi:MAG: hypothetical protein L6Q29_01950 [Candidatus Pacebacteria bacterium]|nr:hypothetical protein [Candidatus Paceibacterota bacterium]
MSKNKIKKTKISSASLKNIPEKEKDYLAAILEEIWSDFKAFGESLDFVRQKGDATFEEVGRIRVELEEMNFRLTNVEDEVKFIRTTLEVLKTSLNKKADIDFLKKLEERVIRIERHLRISAA